MDPATSMYPEQMDVHLIKKNFLQVIVETEEKLIKERGDEMEDQSDTKRTTNLIPMKTVNNEGSMDAANEYFLGDTNVAEYLPDPSSTSAADTALDRFVRNEITYDEFMRLSGGQTIHEEMGDADEVYECEEMIAGPSQTSNATSSLSTDNELPRFVRDLMKEAINQGNEIDQSMSTENLQQEEEDKKVPLDMSALHTSDAKPPKRNAKAMDALLGQANLHYARGKVQEALEVLLEVIKQDHRNAAAYQQVSDMYTECGDKQKSLQYGLLAAHLNNKTPADMWAHLGDLATELGLLAEASACYGRAIKLDMGNFIYYEKRIETLDAMGSRPMAMRMRLQAMQEINTNNQIDWSWFENCISMVSNYFYSVHDEDRAITCLEIFITRSREFKQPAQMQHETLMNLLLSKGRYFEASRSILALVDGIKVVYASGEKKYEEVLEIFFIGGVYFVRPYPPPENVLFLIEDKFPTIMIARLIVCYLSLGRKDLADQLKDDLLRRNLDDPQFEPHLLEVAKAYYTAGSYKICKSFIDTIRQFGNIDNNGELYYIYGNVLAALKDAIGAGKSYEDCLKYMPNHVDARINLASLQLKAGNPDLALTTLQGYDLDTCSILPDERLLIRQAEVLYEEKKIDQFIRCARMLLTPHFYEIYKNGDAYQRKRQSRGMPVLSNILRTNALNVIQNTPFEKFVKRLGAAAVNEDRSTTQIDVSMLHDYCFKLLETLLTLERYHDALVVCCYAFLQPRMAKTPKNNTFRNLLYYCAIKANSWGIAFEFIRWFHSTKLSDKNGETSPQLHKKIFNAMNFVFCHSQNVSYHRFIMRALAKSNENHALQTISGNNSLITGTYRHALGEYLQVWHQNQNNPLLCLLLALTFTHMSCKKDLSSRHMIALRGIAFMKKYEKARTCQPEVWYNIGRMFQQMSIMPLAIHFYKKVLNSPPPLTTMISRSGEEIDVTGKYDLRPFAAHNLALIYKTSGNEFLARQIYEKYLTV